MSTSHMKRADHRTCNDDSTETKRPRLLHPDDDDDQRGDTTYSKWPSPTYYSLSGSKGSKTSDHPPSATCSDSDCSSQVSFSSDRAKKGGSGSSRKKKKEKTSEPNGAARGRMTINLISLTGIGTPGRSHNSQYPRWPAGSPSSSLSSSSSGSLNATCSVATSHAAGTTTTAAESVNSRSLSSDDCGNKKGAATAATASSSSASSIVRRTGNTRKEREGSTSRFIQTPHSNDVLCGRGPAFYSHEGNVAFRRITSGRKAEYVLASSHDEKTKIAREVLALMRQLDPPARFLERAAPVGDGEQQQQGQWIEADPDKTFAKTSQALREGAPTIRDQARAAILGSGGKAGGGGGSEMGTSTTATHAALGLDSAGAADGAGVTLVQHLTPAQLRVQAELVMRSRVPESGTQPALSQQQALLEPLASIVSPAGVSAQQQQHAARNPFGSLRHHHQAPQAVPSVHVHVQVQGGGAAQATGHNQWPAAPTTAASAGQNSPGYGSLWASLHPSLLATAAAVPPNNDYGSLLARLNASLLAGTVPKTNNNININNNGYESLLESLNATPPFAAHRSTASSNNRYESLYASMLLANDRTRSHAILNLLRMLQQRE